MNKKRLIVVDYWWAGSSGTAPADEWILATGDWRDEGVWQDDDVWID